MNILMVHNFYQIGGGEHTVFTNEKRLLAEHGHHVAAYTRDNAELNYSKRRMLFLPVSSVFSLTTYREVKKIIKSEKIEIVHCQNTFPMISPSVYYAAWSCGVPVVQTIHNFRLMCPCGVCFRDGKICEDCIEKDLSQAAKHKCYRNSRIGTAVVANMLRIHRFLGTYKKIRYIFLTEFNREKFRALLGDKVDREFVKPNFEYIDVPDFSGRRNGSFVYMGRLEENKGILFLIKAWKNIRRDLIIFGNGVEREAVEKAAEDNPFIHFKGFRPQTEVFDSLRNASGLIFPSVWYEGFPMTLIEAFAYGTPVVCADIGNQGDIVTSAGAGALFKSGDIDSFSKAVDDVLDNFEEYSSKARHAYLEKYTPEKNYRMLKAIYEAVITENEQHKS